MLLAVLGIVTCIAALPACRAWQSWGAEGISLADSHARYEVAHKGWSFPGRIQTAPVPQADGTSAPIVLGWLIGPDAELRVHLPIDDAPALLLDAIVTAEDLRFYEHGGVDFRSMARAAVANAQEGTWSQGGSTLTMQVVRNLSGRREKTLIRKVREIALARAVDAHLGKRGVLGMYLDAPYLGQRGGISICGFEAAAQHYFGHPAARLTLAEAATLASILPSPGSFAPDRYPERAKERRDRLLTALAAEKGYDVSDALASPVRTVVSAAPTERFPAYLSMTRMWLEQRLPPEAIYGSGLVVTVGVDVAAQSDAEAWFPTRTRAYEAILGRRGAEPLQTAAILMDSDTGLIRAVYGGENATSITFNRATQARRQPGSAFKPVVYAMAFDQTDAEGLPRFTAAHTEANEPRTFSTPGGDWSPRNVAGEYSPTACLAHALAWSQNLATLGLLEEMGGVAPLVAFAKRVGFDTSAYRPELGLALGEGEATLVEMAQFTALIANGGRRVAASPLISAVDAAGAARLAAPTAGEQVISAEAAALTRELMRVVVEGGSGSGVRGRGDEPGYAGQAMGKTGTTDDERDLWFIGATPGATAVVWLGYDTPTSVGGSAADLAAPLWGAFMRRVTPKTELKATFPAEPKVVRRSVCAYTGLPAGETCRTISAPFLPGTEPRGACPIVHPPEVKAGPARRPGFESLWHRLEREREEAEAQMR